MNNTNKNPSTFVNGFSFVFTTHFCQNQISSTNWNLLVCSFVTIGSFVKGTVEQNDIENWEIISKSILRKFLFDYCLCFFNNLCAEKVINAIATKAIIT